MSLWRGQGKQILLAEISILEIAETILFIPHSAKSNNFNFAESYVFLADSAKSNDFNFAETTLFIPHSAKSNDFNFAESKVFYTFAAKSKTDKCMNEILGRHKEIARFQTIMKSDEAEFVVVYGRRRIGKTYLIRQFFEGKFYFYFSGNENSPMTAQLENFKIAFQNYFGLTVTAPENWTVAFEMLRKEIERSRKRGKKVIFIDEMPWLATVGANFVQAFEYWWNTYASANPDILLIVCGSSTSWMLNKIIKNRGGLHNRVTQQIHLQPFTLNECEEYAQYKKLGIDRQTVLDYYSILGGVPYYWKLLEKSLGLPQNIDNLFFSKTAALDGEFQKIFNSLFRNSEKYILLIEALSKKRMGLTREEIVKYSGFQDGGAITKMLEELEQCGFIRSYNAFGKKTKNKIFQLIDCYSLFYLNFIKNNNEEQFWTNNFRTAKVNSWRGYAFEQVCLWHIPQIKQKLGIASVSVSYSSWRNVDTENQTQIDLIIDRADRVINLCEMKYAPDEYVITKEYNETLRKRYAAFAAATKTRKTVHTTLITTYGINRNNSYLGEVQSEVKMEDLFEDLKI
ncbi:MAG: ATP-binding protein [Prevotellaceae bacterium]|nr:ATP-binding protein [Prevotellaceae bacterium]